MRRWFRRETRSHRRLQTQRMTSESNLEVNVIMQVFSSTCRGMQECIVGRLLAVIHC